MTRWFPHLSEIICRADQASAEMVLPNAIYHYTCGHWITRARDPFRECQATTGGIGSYRTDLRRGAVEQRDESRLDFIAWRPGVATFQQVRLYCGALRVADAHRNRQRFRPFSVD